MKQFRRIVRPGGAAGAIALATGAAAAVMSAAAVVIGAAAVVIGAAMLPAGCAPPPPPAEMGDHRDVPEGEPILLEAVIVDVNSDAGTLTVKDVQDHGTWTVATDEQCQIRGANGGDLTMTEIGIGDRVQIRGTTRVPSIINADEIDVVEAIGAGRDRHGSP